MITKELFAGTPGAAFRLRQVRPGIHQLVAPIFHEDGDMMTIFLEEEAGAIKITDHGMSLMRLSYLFDVDTDNKRKILSDIISSRNAELRDGSLESIAPADDVFPFVMNYVQLVSEVCNMNILNRETVTNLFYDLLREVVDGLNVDAQCIPDYQLPGLPNINIDYAFLRKSVTRPIYLFGIKDTHKALQTTINCLQLQLKKVPSKTVGVFDDPDALTKMARANVLDSIGKTFSSVDSFKEKGAEYIETELELAG